MQRYPIFYLQYSPTRGYADWQLNKKFWEVKPDIIGLSATIKPSKSNESQDTDIKNILSIHTDTMINFFPVPYGWGKKQMTYLPKEECECPNPPNVASESEMTEEDKKALFFWGQYIANIVANTYDNKKSIILAGSYLQTSTIQSELTAFIPKEQILTTASNRTMTSIIKEFTENDKIKVLIAARHFGTGIDPPFPKFIPINTSKFYK